MLKVGDKVQIANAHSLSKNIKKTVGKIVVIQGYSGIIGVEFDEKTGTHHDCDGFGKMGYCYYFGEESSLKLVKETFNYLN